MDPHHLVSMPSQSIGRGSIDLSDGSLSLHPIQIDSSYAIPSSWQETNNHLSHRASAPSSSLPSGRRIENDEPRNVAPTKLLNDTLHSEESNSVIGFEEPIKLTQSTYSFLFTEPVHSVPFAFAVSILLISYTCLILALVDNIYIGYTPENPFSVPVGVTGVVKTAQYLALLVGSIMEEEIPESLHILRMISRSTLPKVDSNFQYRKFVICAMLRIIMGYLFIVNMFVVVVQATRVIDIFFNVLALQFLQQVDDIAFRLAKMDVFGKRVKKASTRKCFRSEFEKLPFARRKKMTVFVKALYIINFCLLMVGLSLITQKQLDGAYQCTSITVSLTDDVWESVVYLNTTQKGEQQEVIFPANLIYSYFNGVYVKNGTHAGRPRYTEQNKFDDGPYRSKIGATIQYCQEEEAWVFLHERVRKAVHRQKVSCPWLLRSPTTNSYDLLEVLGGWSIWTGLIKNGVTITSSCNECETSAECHFHGKCMDGVCQCNTEEDSGYHLFTGTHCQHPLPCSKLRGNSGDVWDLLMLDNSTFWKTYGRGVYRYESGGNITASSSDIPILMYSGSRWLAVLLDNSENYTQDHWIEYSRELHPFWDELYKNNSHAVSNPTTRSDPIGVDFFQIGRLGEKYGPLGELIPLQDPPGSGYFECLVHPLSSINRSGRF